MPTDVIKHARSMRRYPTPQENALWLALRNRQLGGVKFRRQVAMGGYIADFYCPAARLVVEVDGATHADSAADSRRDAWMRGQGLRVLRVWNNDVSSNLSGVLEQIRLTASPPPGFVRFAAEAHNGRGE